MSDAAQTPSPSPFEKRVFSGVQPSGGLTLGNYLGAVKRFVHMQSPNHESLYCMVDLHAVTVWQDPANLRKNTRELAAFFYCCRIKTEAVNFIQSISGSRTCSIRVDFQLYRPHGVDEADDPIQRQSWKKCRKCIAWLIWISRIDGRRYFTLSRNPCARGG